LGPHHKYHMTSGTLIAAQRRLVLNRGIFSYCVIALVLLTVGLYFLNAHWPYRYEKVEPTLEKIFASHIKINHYHRTYFPYPGFVADGLTLRRNSAPDLPPVGSIEHVRVEGSWLSLLLLRRRISTIYADGLHVVIPPVGSRANKEDFPPGSSSDFEGPDTAIERLVTQGAMLDILRTDGRRYSFPVRSLVVTHLEKSVSVEYKVDMQTPVSGHILASGSFGPLLGGQLGQTHVTGQFTYEGVRLDGISELHGMLNSTGSFHGNLATIEAQAESIVSDFSVNQGHTVRLTGTSTGSVNALNGDMLLHEVDIRTGDTEVRATGRIAGKPKVTDLDVSVARGQAEDLLGPFIRTRAPVVGPVRLRTHIHVAAAEHAEHFLDRLVMNGVFEIPRERLTKASTEKSLTAFSGRAQGKSGSDGAAAAETQDVISSLAGAVVVSKGVAHASRLVFEVPGASIEVNGTFDLRNQTVDMLGDLRMQSDISHVTTGFKSFLLKPLAPFFRKQGLGAVVPVKVTGSPGRYKIRQNLLP